MRNPALLCDLTSLYSASAVRAHREAEGASEPIDSDRILLPYGMLAPISSVISADEGTPTLGGDDALVQEENELRPLP